MEKKKESPEPEATQPKKGLQSKDPRTPYISSPQNKRIRDPTKIERRLSILKLFPYTFVIISDTMFGYSAELEKKNPVVWDKEQDLLVKCIAAINELNPKPKFFVIAGDMCQAQPTGTKEYALRRRQEKDFMKTLETLDKEIFFVAVPGDRDVGEAPNESTVNRYRTSFGKDYFDFTVSGVQFIVLNSLYYVNSSASTSFATEQDKWLEEKLSERSKSSLIGPVIFMHVPPFVESPTEPDTKSSLVKLQRDELLNKLTNAGVRYVFCGHIYKNANSHASGLEVIITSGLGHRLETENPGFRLVTVHENEIKHSFVPIQI